MLRTARGGVAARLAHGGNREQGRMQPPTGGRGSELAVPIELARPKISPQARAWAVDAAR